MYYLRMLKVKFSLSVPWRYIIGSAEVLLHPFLILKVSMQP